VDHASHGNNKHTHKAKTSYVIKIAARHTAEITTPSVVTTVPPQKKKKKQGTSKESGGRGGVKAKAMGREWWSC
jgi:hypothetical protein